MTVTLRRLRPDEEQTWRATSKERYANDMIENGGLPPGIAHAKADEALEQEARALGLDRIELNVFGANAVARDLYGSLGYEEIAVWMGKSLT